MGWKRLLWVGLLVVVLLAGCGEDEEPQEVLPVDTMTEMVQAVEAKDFDQVAQYLCAARQTEFETAMQESIGELEAQGLDRDALLQAVRIDLENMRYEETSREGDTAIVTVEGDMTVTFTENELRDVIQQAAEAQGQQIFEEQLDVLVETLMAASREQEPINEEIAMVLEEDQWRVCDDVEFLDQAEAINLP